MFFAPALAVIAATGMQSVYAAAIPAITQQAVGSIASDLDLSSLFNGAGPSNDKRNVELMEELMRRSLDDMELDEEKQAAIGQVLKGLAPSIVGFAASFLPSLFGGNKDKRDVDLSTLSEDDKQAALGAVLKELAPGIAGFAASFIPSIIGKFSGKGKDKRDAIAELSEEDKKALWPAIAGFAASFIPSIIGKFTNKGKRDLLDLSEEDKEALLYSMRPPPFVGRWGPNGRIVYGRDVADLSEEDKKAFWPLIGAGVSLISSLFSGKNKRALEELNDEDKEAFWQLIPAGISLLSGLFKGKRDLLELRDLQYDSLNDEDKEAFWQLIPAGISLISGLFGKNKRDLEPILALRNVDFNAMSEEDKKALWPALIGGAVSIFSGLFGKNKRDLETLSLRDLEGLSEEDKKAFWPLIGAGVSLISSFFGKNKRSVEEMSDEDKEAFLSGLIAKLMRPLKGVMRRDAVEQLYARDAAFADAFFSEEF
jgi:hypothetical protein